MIIGLCRLCGGDTVIERQIKDLYVVRCLHCGHRREER